MDNNFKRLCKMHSLFVYKSRKLLNIYNFAILKNLINMRFYIKESSDEIKIIRS